MYHPEEEEEEDEDEFLSDDAEVCRSKDQTKVKGQCRLLVSEGLQTLRVTRCVFCSSVFNPAEVGAEGKGYIWKASNLDDTEEDELSQCLWGGAAIPSDGWKRSRAAADLTTAALSLGLVLKPNPESDSEDSEPDDPDDLVIPSPEMDDVKGEVFDVIRHLMI